MSATKHQLEKRRKLRVRYDMGVPPLIARDQIGLTDFTVYRWYNRWIQEDGAKAPTCGCGRSLVHRGRCEYRPSLRSGGGRHRSDIPVYDGPDFIGRAMTAEEAASFRARAAHLN